MLEIVTYASNEQPGNFFRRLCNKPTHRAISLQDFYGRCRTYRYKVAPDGTEYDFQSNFSDQIIANNFQQLMHRLGLNCFALSISEAFDYGYPIYGYL